jgi:hypothetical protein
MRISFRAIEERFVGRFAAGLVAKFVESVSARLGSAETSRRCCGRNQEVNGPVRSRGAGRERFEFEDQARLRGAQ